MIAEVLLLLCLQLTGWAFTPPSHRVMMGEDVNIPCSITIFRPPIDRKTLVLIWYFQGKEILNLRNAKVTSTDPRLSYKARAEDGITDLSISNITIANVGIYKCSIQYRSKIEENEIRLDVQASPQISITDKVIIMNKESSLHSVISGFYPVDIDVKWFGGEDILHKVIMEKPQRDPDGTYSVRSSVTIRPTEEDKDRIFSCRVQHESLTAPLQEQFQLVNGDLPTVNIYSKAFQMDMEQNLVCSVSGFYPESITVNWFLNGTKVENAKTRRISSSAVESVYPFLPTEQNWGMELGCVVDHGTFNTPHVERLLVQATDLTANYKHLTVILSVVLIFSVGGLIIFLLYIKQRKKSHPKVRNITRFAGGTFTLNVDHFKPNSVTVCWEVIQPPSDTMPRSLTSDITTDENQDGTFNATSTCESLRGLIQDNEAYVVRAKVTHPKLKSPQYRNWRSNDKDKTGFTALPQVDKIQFQKLLVNKQTNLQCTISHFYPDELTVDWLIKGKGKEAFTVINNFGRYKIPNNPSKRQQDKTFTYTALLEFTPLLQDQGSEVICRVSHPSLEVPIEKTTGPLQVLAKPEPQLPIKLSVMDSGDVVGSLTLLNFYPEDIDVNWTFVTVRAQEKGQSEEQSTPNGDGTFQLNSKCQIPLKLLENSQHSIKVTWNHKAMEKPESTELSFKDPDFQLHPKIEAISPLILQVNQNTTVKCTIFCYFPEKLKVTWLEKKRITLTDCTKRGIYIISPIEHKKMSNNTYQCLSSLSFTPTSDTEDLEFICRVEHPSLGQPIEQSTGPPRRNVPPKKQDVKLTLQGSDQVLCSLSLMEFYPENVTIKWSSREHFRSNIFHSTKKIIKTDDNDKIFDAISECVIPLENLKSSVRVTWTHGSLPEPGSRDLHITDLPWQPVIEDISYCPFIEKKETKLQCKISHYFPSNLTVTWHKKEKNGKMSRLYGHNTSRAELQPDNTYSCTASLPITPSLLTEQGSEFICKVEHLTLKEPIERSTGPVQVWACPKIVGPIKWSLTNTRTAMFTLQLERFYPKTIKLEWSLNGRSLSGIDNYVNNDDTTWNVTNECTVSQNDLTHPNPIIRVTWKHDTMSDPESRELCIRDLPWSPEVSEITSTGLILEHLVTVRCDICNYFPDNLTVTWYVKKKGSQEYERVDLKQRPYKIIDSQPQYSESGYSRSSSVEFTPFLYSYHGVMFKCEVKHPSLKHPIERITQPLFIKSAPKVKESVKLTPCDPDDVLCSVRLENFFPRDINFKWTFGSNQREAFTTEKTLLVEEDMERFGVISECKISWKQLEFPVRVSWTHETLKEPQCEEFIGPDFPWRPQIQMLDSPYLILNTESKIQCRISGFFPKNLNVDWFRKDEETNYPTLATITKGYTKSLLDHQKHADNTYSCIASLAFTPSQMEPGLKFICKVERPSLKETIEQTIKPLPLMGIVWHPNIDSFDVSDFKLNKELNIQCKISGYSPNDLTVTWLKKGKGKNYIEKNGNDKYKIPHIQHIKQRDNTYSCTATLQYTPSNDGQEFMCRVDHSSLKYPIEMTTGILKDL